MRKKLTEKEKKERKEMLKNESPVNKFKRVVTPRVRKALKDIKLIGNCSSNDYAYNEEQVHKIFGELYEQVKATENKFKGGGPTDNTFEL